MSKDISNLRSVILHSLDQAQYAFTVENSNALPQIVQYVVLHGMGGSALPGEVINASLADLGASSVLPLHIHRDYGTESYVDKRFLTIICSYSGNTEETISALEDCLERQSSVVVIAAGGALIDLAKEKSLPYILLPKPGEMFQPRYATLYMVKAIFTLLEKVGYTDPHVLQNFMQNLESVQVTDFEERGKELASILKGKTPVIYASHQYAKVSHIWKIKMNENAKTPAFHNFFPELNHNEMVGFTLPQANFQFVFLKNASESSPNTKRMEIMKGLLEKKGMSVLLEEVKDHGSFFANFIAMLTLGDWTAYYLALEYGIDPTPVDMVEEFKERMK